MRLAKQGSTATEQMRQQLLSFEAAAKVAQQDADDKDTALSLAKAQLADVKAALDAAAAKADKALQVTFYRPRSLYNLLVGQCHVFMHMGGVTCVGCHAMRQAKQLCLGSHVGMG